MDIFISDNITAELENDPDGLSNQLFESINMQIPGIPFTHNETDIIIDTLSLFSNQPNLTLNTTNNLLLSVDSILVNGVDVDGEDGEIGLREDFNE